MDKPTLLYLLEKFRQGNCTEAEEQLLHQWLELLEQDAGPGISLSDEEKQRIRNNMLQNILSPTARSPRRLILRSWMKVAAILLPLIGTGYFLWLQQQPATITRAVEWHTRHNATAQVQQLLLPDSSLVMLNAHTSIQYPANYNEATRSVRLLKGKAFFNVRTDPQHPFIVESNGIHTTVLGTSFSVAAYKGLYTCRVTVMTGKVQVHTKGNNYGMLTPAQRITIADGNIQPLRDTIAVADAMAWTRGEIVLHNATLQELMHMLREQYGVTTSTHLNVQQGSYTVRLPVTMPLTAVLEVIEKISYKPKIRFTMKEDLLTIY